MKMPDYPFAPATVFLPRWQVACRGNRCVLVANLLINAGVNIELISQFYGIRFKQSNQQNLAQIQIINIGKIF